MLKDFFETLCNTILTRLKFLRKGAALIMLIFTSLVILIDCLVLHNPFTIFGGSIFHQIVCLVWMYSFLSILIKAYNEYCDKKDAKKAEQEEIKQKEQQDNEQKEKRDKEILNRVNKYFEMFDYCDVEEKNVLIKFYIDNKTSIKISEYEMKIIKALRLKGVDIISYSSDHNIHHQYKAFTSVPGLQIIQKYFDKNKEEIFKIFETLTKDEKNILYEFCFNDAMEIKLSNNQKKYWNIVKKFEKQDNMFFWIDEEKKLFKTTFSSLGYMKRIFDDNKF